LGVVARAAKLQAKDQLHRCLQFHLHEVQECFLLLLTDAKSNQLSRESCCLGLASCNKLAIPSESNELKGRLLKAFGQTTNYGSSAMQETPEQAEQRRRAERMNDDGESPAADASAIVDIGGAAGMSEASLGAYREMAAAAVASGRPDILYSMLILSVSHPIWTSSVNRRDAYGPSALQGDSFNREEVKIALRPFLSRLLPRILRACHE
jgi:proteasome component ECM29